MIMEQDRDDDRISKAVGASKGHEVEYATELAVHCLQKWSKRKGWGHGVGNGKMISEDEARSLLQQEWFNNRHFH